MKTYRVPLGVWRNAFFAQRPPTLKRLRGNIKAGKIPGEEVGQGTGIYIVHCDADYNPVWPAGKNPTPQTGNTIADAILKKYQENHAQA